VDLWRQEPPTHGLDASAELFRQTHGVDAGALGQCHRDGGHLGLRGLPEARIGRPEGKAGHLRQVVRRAIHDPRQINQAEQTPVLRMHDDRLELCGRRDTLRQPQRPVLPGIGALPERLRDVGCRDRIGDLVEGDAEGVQPLGQDLDPDLPGPPAHHEAGADPGGAAQPLEHALGDAPELGVREPIGGEGQREHRHVVHVDGLDPGLPGHRR
jgi:hypothetical protein